MWKWLTMSMVALAMLAGVAQAARDITGPLDIVQGVPNDGVTTGGATNGWPAGELPRYICDDQVSTKFLHFKGEVEPTGVRITPAVGGTIVVGVTFTTANDGAERDPVKYELSGSNGSIDGPYTLIASGDIKDFAGATAWARLTKTTTAMQFANTVAYKHYQVMFPAVRTPASANSMQIAEIELLGNIFLASAPDPADGAIGVTMPLFQWTKGDTAVFYDLYLGAGPDLSEADLRVSHLPAANTVYYHADTTLEPGVVYYWRVDSIDAKGVVYAGNVWHFTIASKAAWAPKPSDGVAYVSPDAELSWAAGLDAMAHDIYLSEDRAAVEAGAPEARKAAQQFTTSYAPSELQPGKTYFWRVDEVLADNGIEVGPVWSFSVRPIMTKTDPSLVGWWKMEGENPDLAVDYSGYDNYGTLLGGPTFVDGYLGEALSFDGVNDCITCPATTSLSEVESVTVAAWVRLNVIGGDRKIAGNEDNATGGYKFGIYSSNQAEFEIRDSANAPTNNRAAGGGVMLGQNVWYHVAGVYEKGVAIRTYVNGKLDRETPTAVEAGISNGSLIIGRETYAQSNWWLGLMDDVRVYNKALTEVEIQDVMRGDLSLAWDPQPETGVNLDIRDATTLEWAAGKTASQHDVYFGQDKNAVKAADASSTLYQGRQAGTSFSLNGLVEFGGGTYCWRIDEVEADGVTVHKGSVWSFTVPNHLIVDEFEGYDDADNRIFDVWLDGYGDDNNGSVVGYIDALNGTFGERTIVHGGRQSMPFDYDNTSASYSQAERTFNPIENWTGNGVTDLTLFVYGYPVVGEVAVTETAGKISLTSTGADIWGSVDRFTYAFKTLTGDGTLIARVVSTGTGADNWSKGGVMIRESLNGGSANAMMVITGGGGNVGYFQYRDTTGGGSAGVDSPAVLAAPYWVKIERSGATLSGYTSNDGKLWSPVGSALIEMADSVCIGLAVTAHTAGQERTYQFDSISTTGSVSGAWTGAVISAAVHNSAQPLYVTVEDSTGKKATATDAAAVTTAGWNEVKIPLTRFTGVAMSKVKKIIVGVGDPANPSAHGTGRIFIDDIRVTTP